MGMKFRRPAVKIWAGTGVPRPAGVERLADKMKETVASLGFFSYGPDDIFRKTFGAVNFYASAKTQSYYCERFAGSPPLQPGVICYKNSKNHLTDRLIVHELGHVFNATLANKLNHHLLSGFEKPYDALSNEGIWACVFDPRIKQYAMRQIAGNTSNGYLRTDLGYNTNYLYDNEASTNEDFADMFSHWAYNSFTKDAFGAARQNWMNYHMAFWLAKILNLPVNVPPLPLD